jgi:hypothetical protein
MTHLTALQTIIDGNDSAEQILRDINWMEEQYEENPDQLFQLSIAVQEEYIDVIRDEVEAIA